MGVQGTLTCDCVIIFRTFAELFAQLLRKMKITNIPQIEEGWASGFDTISLLVSN